MRKKFIESTSYYAVLEELNSLPFGCATTPYYYKRKYNFIDVYVSFIQDIVETETSEEKKHVIFAFFYSKPKDVRRSSLVRPICQISCELDDFLSVVLEPRVCKLNDFINILAFKYTELSTALDYECRCDTQ